MLQAGEVTIHFLNDGFWWDDGGAQFGIVPRELWQKEKQPNEKGRIRMSLTCPLIIDGKNIILVDTGIGNRLTAREQQYFAPSRGDGLVGQLSRIDINPGDVTHVILSHLHFDHLGGVIRKAEDGSVKTVFPNASVMIQRAEWDLATNPPDERNLAAYRHAIECLEPMKNVQLVSGNISLNSRVRTSVSGGHTSSHQCVIVESDGGGLIHFADIVPTTSHLRPSWNAAYDTEPLTTMASKKALFQEARDKRLWVSFSHDDTFAAGLFSEDNNARYPTLEKTIDVSLPQNL